MSEHKEKIGQSQSSHKINLVNPYKYRIFAAEY